MNLDDKISDRCYNLIRLLYLDMYEDKYDYYKEINEVNAYEMLFEICNELSYSFVRQEKLDKIIKEN